MTLANLAKSYVRTIVPAVVGLIVALALRAGFDLHGYAPEITTGVTFVYYALVRLAEEHLSPQFGWLLGVAASPQYVRQAKARTRLPAAGETVSHQTFKLHADTTELVAALKAAEVQANRTAAAVKKAKKA